MTIQVEINLTVKQPGAETRNIGSAPFLRRDFAQHQELYIDLPAGRRVPANSVLSKIQFIMLRVVDGVEDGAIVNIYRNLSPEWWQITDFYGAWEVSNCTALSFKSDKDARIHLVVGGE